MPATAAVVQMVISPQMSRISHPMNCLDRWSNLVSNHKASPDMGPFPRVVVDLLATTDYGEIKESKGIRILQK